MKLYDFHCCSISIVENPQSPALTFLFLRIVTKDGICDQKKNWLSAVSIKFFLFANLFPWFSFPGCCAQQMFREEPQYTEVNPGANAELRCVIENIGGECRWQKDGKVSLKFMFSKRATKNWCNVHLRFDAM